MFLRQFLNATRLDAVSIEYAVNVPTAEHLMTVSAWYSTDDGVQVLESATADDPDTALRQALDKLYAEWEYNQPGAG